LEQAEVKKQKLTFTELVRARFKGVLDPVAGFFNRLGIYPNTMTILGLAGNVVGAVLIGFGHMTIGGIIILVMGAVDSLDGTMARLRGMPSDFGAFVDSVTDRYSELVIFAGLLLCYSDYASRLTGRGNWLPVLGVYLAAAGSVLVSYVRARAASLGMDTKIGLLTRFERYLVLAPALIFNIPIIGIWIIAVLANVTAVQRIVDVRRQAREQNKILH
jgi:CDP-diacylglycerol--glycerol-3-phosphate 3-phosphatidyltransferase